MLIADVILIKFYHDNALRKEAKESGIEVVQKNPTQTPAPTTSIILTGDVMLGRSVMITSLEKMKNPLYPFSLVANDLSNANLVFINLENPIVTDCPRIEGGFTFCADPEMIRGLVYSGVDIVTLANNHSRNFGERGFQETIDLLQKAGIASVGYGNLVIKEVNETKFGFLGFDFLKHKLLQLELV